MRKKFIYFVLIPLIILFTIIYIFIDSWIESGLEYAGTKAVGAKVEIDNLRLSINPIAIEFSRLQVTDPKDGWSNIFETGKVKFELNFAQLLRGKYIIETVQVNNLILNTIRTSDGSIPKEKIVETVNNSVGSTENNPLNANVQNTESKSDISFDIDKIKKELNLDSLLNPKNLASYKHIDSIKLQLNDANIKWKKSLEEIDKTKPKLSEIENGVKSINLNNIKNLQTANNELNNIKNILKNANEVNATFNEHKNELTSSINKINQSIKDIDNIVKEDYQNILSKAKLPDVSMAGLSEMLLGRDVINKAYDYLDYLQMIKKKVQNTSSKPPIENVKRFEGQNIHFPTEKSYPKFWIKEILISGGTDKAQNPNYFYAKGSILNISSDQRITGKPLTVDLMATKAFTTTLKLGASIDRTKNISLDKYKAELTNLPLKEMIFGKSNFLPSKVQGANMDAKIQVEIPEHNFDANTNIAFKKLNFVFEKAPNGIVEKIVHNVLSSVNEFNLKLRMWKVDKKFDIAFSTDLDNILSAKTKQVIGEEIQKIQNDIKKKLNDKIAEKKNEVEKIYQEKRNDIEQKIKSYENQLNEKLQMVESKKKEIENKIEAEKKKQTDAIKDKATGAVKKIFKK